MTRIEKAKQYRQLAREALSKAEGTADPKMRQSFIELASGWYGLATQLEEAALESELALKHRNRPA